MPNFSAGMHKFNFGWGSAQDLAGRAYNAPPDRLAGGDGLASPPDEPHPAVGPSDLDPGFSVLKKFQLIQLLHL